MKPRAWMQHFYPRPPRGGRPASVGFAVVVSLFLSTPSARRATGSAVHWIALPAISIHALREEGDLGQLALWRQLHDFYPRPPRGGRPVDGRIIHVLVSISIHALREEGDRAADRAKARAEYFYPRPPRGGRQHTSKAEQVHRVISIHALREEGDLRKSGRASNSQENFYPRPPRGGRPNAKTGRRGWN